MLTKEQENWLSHLSKEKIVEVLPYDPKTKEVFVKVKQEIELFLGKVEILHCGSTALEILGQGEIDLYIPIDGNHFDEYLTKMIEHLGKAGSVYPLKRARFVKYVDDIKVEIFLINWETDDWKNSLTFESYLRKNSRLLGEYIELKEKSRGLSIQDYYRRKTEFINKILMKE